MPLRPTVVRTLASRDIRKEREGYGEEVDLGWPGMPEWASCCEAERDSGAGSLTACLALGNPLPRLFLTYVIGNAKLNHQTGRFLSSVAIFLGPRLGGTVRDLCCSSSCPG